jgi:hypothetical protein
MTLRAARALVSLYPSRWRDRYGEEFIGFLQVYPATPRTLLNVLRNVIDECFRERGEVMLRASREPMMLMVYSVLLAFAGGRTYIGLSTTARLRSSCKVIGYWFSAGI